MVVKQAGPRGLCVEHVTSMTESQSRSWTWKEDGRSEPASRHLDSWFLDSLYAIVLVLHDSVVDVSVFSDVQIT